MTVSHNQCQPSIVDSNEFKIEQGIPIGRDTPTCRLLRTALELKAGDSFIVPSGMYLAAEKARALANKRGGKFTIRVTDDGWRFWRVR